MPCRNSPFFPLQGAEQSPLSMDRFSLLQYGAMASYRRATEVIMDRDKDHFGHPWELHRDSEEDSLENKQGQTDGQKETNDHRGYFPLTCAFYFLSFS